MVVFDASGDAEEVDIEYAEEAPGGPAGCAALL